MTTTDTIAAISTPAGKGAIAIVRLSGPDAIAIADKIWRGKSLSSTPSHRIRFGTVVNSAGETLDEAVATIMRAPHSFTGEDTVEFACHGSRYIQQHLLNTLLDAGARLAGPGEFSQRAFLNGKMDLARAESVADLIDSGSRAAHRLAMSQMRGDFSSRLDNLRNRLIEFASLLELELDFSEEDVEFADRTRLLNLASEVKNEVDRLSSSFNAGHAIKEGIPTAIIGAPNTGKSTLLNRLLGDDKAIVSDIPGTTRDAIEDTIDIQGTTFRLIDTAGLRHTTDTIEQMGIQRTRALIGKALVVLALVDASKPIPPQIKALVEEADLQSTLPSNNGYQSSGNGKSIIIIANKTDLVPHNTNPASGSGAHDNNPAVNIDGINYEILPISAATGEGVDALLKKLAEIATSMEAEAGDVIVTNARHYRELTQASEALARVMEGLASGLPTDLVAQDLREAIAHIGAITGKITSETLLHSIFSKFCIGK